MMHLRGYDLGYIVVLSKYYLSGKVVGKIFSSLVARLIDFIKTFIACSTIQAIPAERNHIGGSSNR